jgi:mannose/fructose/N-acetylgalactosamine-specific phosphotransferase system component IIB
MGAEKKNALALRQSRIKMLASDDGNLSLKFFVGGINGSTHLDAGTKKVAQRVTRDADNLLIIEAIAERGANVTDRSISKTAKETITDSGKPIR